MRLMKVAVGAVNQTPMKWRENIANILQAISMAQQQGISLLCLPELCLVGYGTEDHHTSPGVLKRSLDLLLDKIVPATKGIAVSVGLALVYDGAIYNCSAFIVDGRLQGFFAKQNLAGDGNHYEYRWFKRWPSGLVRHITLRGETYPIGDVFFQVDGVKIGFELCEDAWVAHRPGRDLAGIGVDIILNPSASHYAFGKHQVRVGFVTEGSRAFGVSYLYANLLGNEAGRLIFDGDCMVASGGKIVAQGKRFSFQSVVVTSAVIDVDATSFSRARTPSWQPSFSEHPQLVTCKNFSIPQIKELPSDRPHSEAWENSAQLEFEEFLRAAALGLFDYLRKSGLRGFALSLSGGADSSSVALLVRMMLELAVAELGFKETMAKLPKVEATNEQTIDGVMRNILFCAYQGSQYSSEDTRTSAREVAKALGARYEEWEIDGLVADYKQIICRVLGRELDLSDRTDSLVDQNLQARVRSPGIWGIANAYHFLLLTTSNRSEAGVGYSTMDGDTSGALNPIGGISKEFLLRWLPWMQNEGPTGLHPWPVLRYVTVLQPSAELAADQTDEKDLMPYPVLNAIEGWAVRDKLMPVEVFALMQLWFSRSYQRDMLARWVRKFFSLWSRNQWKRERFAISFHYDDRNLDPKTWCRFPVLSGGFEEELEDLDLELSRAA